MNKKNASELSYNHVCEEMKTRGLVGIRMSVKHENYRLFSAL